MREQHVFETSNKKLYKRSILAPILVQCTDLTKVLLENSKHKGSSPTILQIQTGMYGTSCSVCGYQYVMYDSANSN